MDSGRFDPLILAKIQATVKEAEDHAREGRNEAAKLIQVVQELLPLITERHHHEDAPLVLAILSRCRSMLNSATDATNRWHKLSSNSGEEKVQGSPEYTCKKKKWNVDVEKYVENLREKSNVQWNDIVGHDKAKEAMRSAVVFPRKYSFFFGQPPNSREACAGVLLFGVGHTAMIQATINLPAIVGKFQGEKTRLLNFAEPSGTGKTKLVYAAASEANCTFLKLKVGNFMAKYYGESEERISAFFDYARKNSPSVVFIDEIEHLVSQRDAETSGDMGRIKGHLLDEMNDLHKDGVTVIGVTNHPEIMDKAFKRRFQKRLYIGLPTLEERLRIFYLYTGKKRNTLTKKNVQKLASKTEGFSGDDIKNVVEEASLVQVKREISLHEKSKAVNNIIQKVDDTVLTYAALKTILHNTSPTTPDYEILQFEVVAEEMATASF